MRYDIDRLETFYASPLGRMARDMISSRIAALWPRLDGLDVMGFGHADPLLAAFHGKARRVISVSPEGQGATRWPPAGPCAAVLAEEERLPLPDAMFDRLVICHGIEEAERPERMLREFWRVAAPEARILFIVANRRGLWARADSTPFGHGRPYTRMQLYRLIEDAVFQPTAFSRALFAPPVNLTLVTTAGEAWERIGGVAWSRFGGVLMVEAVKRVLPGPPVHPERVRRTVRATPRGVRAAAAQPHEANPGQSYCARCVSGVSDGR